MQKYANYYHYQSFKEFFKKLSKESQIDSQPSFVASLVNSRQLINSPLINTTGSFTLPGCLILSSFLYLFLITTHLHLKTFKLSLDWGATTLCLKKSIRVKKEYLSKMFSLNSKIKILKPLTLIPKTRVFATTSIKIIKKIQYVTSLQHISGLIKYPECKSTQLLISPLSPYMRGAKIIRSKNETAKLISKKTVFNLKSKNNFKIFYQANLKHIKQGGVQLEKLISSNQFEMQVL